MSSVWAKISAPESVNLKNIMSEELAKNIEAKQLKRWSGSVSENCEEILDCTIEDFSDVTDNSEKGEDESCEDAYDVKYWDQFCRIPPCVCIIKDANIFAEPDVTLSGRRKACKCMSFPQQFYAVDRMQCSRTKNDTINNFATDLLTKMELCKMLNKQIIKEIDTIIDVGKEAVILHAMAGVSNPHKECVVKIYKTSLTEFKKHKKYIWDDPFFKIHTGKKSVRKTMYLWAQKEALNLGRLSKAGVLCPDVIALRKHILVMSLIGDNSVPALKLKNASLNLDEYISAYKQVTEFINILYNKANLIHGDLSENNILWHNRQCYFIDVAQSTEPCHQDAFLFLMQDCENVTNFFMNKNIPNVQTAEQLFVDVTGCDNKNRIALEDIRNSFKTKYPPFALI